jgi:hypothetical protein
MLPGRQMIIKMKKTIFAGIALLILAAGICTAFPPVSSDFFGKATIDGIPAIEGTLIEAYDTNNVLCGRTLVKKDGIYGYLSCNGDDPLTERDEGANTNEQVIFFLDKRKVTLFVPAIWKEGSKQEINIFVGKPPVIVEEETPKTTGIFRTAEYLFLISLSIGIFLIAYLYIHKDKKKEKF